MLVPQLPLGAYRNVTFRESDSDLENNLDLVYQGHLMKMGYNFVNVRVRTSVCIGSLWESDPCESDVDLEDDLDLVFQGHLIKLGYNFLNMHVRLSVTIGSLQESDY